MNQFNNGSDHNEKPVPAPAEPAVDPHRARNVETLFPRRQHYVIQAPATPTDRSSFTDGKRSSTQQFPQTQMGNAERLVARFGHSIRYCASLGRWLIWVGSRWAPDETSRIYEHAIQTVRAIREVEANALNDEKARAALCNFSYRSEQLKQLEDMIELAKTIRDVSIPIDQLDSDRYLFNCANGTVDLRTGELRKHDHRDHLTKLSPVEYHPDAKCPRWKQFLKEVFQEDKQLILFIQRALGCALTGKPEKAVFFLVGNGDNGKTTLLEAFRYVMGDYAAVAKINLLMQKATNNEQQYAIAALTGKRFVTASETQEGERLNEAVVKQLTGGGRLQARHAYGSPFEFDPQFKLFIDANHKPDVQGADHAIWQRMQVIPFPRIFSESEKDKALPGKLRDEAPGILAWAVKGCLAWDEHGLPEATKVTEAVAAYREEQDVVGEFIAECCTLDEEASTPAAELHAQFREWSWKRGERQPLSAKMFGKRLEAKGFRPVRSASTRRWRGLRLKVVGEDTQL